MKYKIYGRSVCRILETSTYVYSFCCPDPVDPESEYELIVDLDLSQTGNFDVKRNYMADNRGIRSLLQELYVSPKDGISARDVDHWFLTDAAEYLSRVSARRLKDLDEQMKQERSQYNPLREFVRELLNSPDITLARV